MKGSPYALHPVVTELVFHAEYFCSQMKNKTKKTRGQKKVNHVKIG